MIWSRISAKRSRILLFLALALLMSEGASAADPVSIPAIPWTALGRINAKGMSFCTGALIGPDTVLTAAHCVYNFKAKRWRQPREIHFVAGYYRGDYVAVSRAKRIQRAANFTPVTTGITIPHIQKDWAIVTLEKAIGHQAGWFALERQRRNLHKALVIQAGYSRSRPHIAELSSPCRVMGTLRKTVWVHDCVVPKGGSGSPMFVVDGNQIKIAGVHSAQMEGRKTAKRGTAVIPLWTFMPKQADYPVEPKGHTAALAQSIVSTLKAKSGTAQQALTAAYAVRTPNARHPLFRKTKP